MMHVSDQVNKAFYTFSRVEDHFTVRGKAASYDEIAES